MKRNLLVLTATALILSAFIYKNTGKPWHGKMQQLPGRLECEYYDEGGEGIAYHDTDIVNNGSGKLNPANGTFLNEFRMNEGVDISYTKTGNIDNNAYNRVPRDLNKLYVGWTKPDEWINYTVKVTKTGTYPVGVLYTSNGDGSISLDIDGKDATGLLRIASTHDDRDTVAWRQWHHWNASDSIGSITLKKGIHLLTLHIVTNGNMNLDYLNFGKAIK
ncbi:Carbohydrate binding module (family 6) [Mucilaginibacter gossypiicola]|uniref:Carbohydrate binding module (Family 6) n=1 Tax=Mucilaginibacter gossypiicola TaxID=551995 RepID=A0A1H7ZIC2_9SPHI|nr:carbohydrate-binding protein [Mucilaginibacter gossypiicola]SEM58170.1 Carbohydrate binding module (family 6) [Mucilaginibacter gossypiicola]